MNKILDVLRFGLRYLRRYRVRLAVGVLLGVLFGLSNAGFVWATRTLIERMAPGVESPAAGEKAEATGEPGFLESWKARLKARSDAWVDPWLPEVGRSVDWKQVLGGLLLFPLLVGVRGAAGYTSKYFMAWVGERSVNDMRTDVLVKLNSLSIDYFNRATMGDMVTHVNGDTGTVQRCLQKGVSDLIEQPTTLIGVLGAMCLIDWKLTACALLFFPVCAVPVFILGRKARYAGRAVRDVTATQSSLLYEMLLGVRVVKAFGLEAIQENRFREHSRELVRQGMKAIRARELSSPIIETIAMSGFGLLILYIAYSNRSVGDMVGFLMALVFIYTPIKRLAAIHVMFEQASISIDRLMRIFSEKPSIREPASPRPLKEFQKEISFEAVNFAYGKDLVLEDFNLFIPRGYRLGIAGESGSGKSTAINLLYRFFDPTSGSIQIDGTDLREVSSNDLRLLMAMVSQEVMLFDLTVAENIALGKPDGASRKEIENAARAAFAHGFISELPDGYDSRVGERGINLSAGQRQRICIARAFVRNAPILMLDEATASLDSQSESEVQAAIDRLAENRTVISVAHRLSTLARMDEIIVLSRGRIIERGNYDELLRLDGTFRNMARKQGIVSAANL